MSPSHLHPHILSENSIYTSCDPTSITIVTTRPITRHATINSKSQSLNWNRWWNQSLPSHCCAPENFNFKTYDVTSSIFTSMWTQKLQLSFLKWCHQFSSSYLYDAENLNLALIWGLQLRLYTYMTLEALLYQTCVSIMSPFFLTPAYIGSESLTLNTYGATTLIFLPTWCPGFQLCTHIMSSASNFIPMWC